MRSALQRLLAIPLLFALAACYSGEGSGQLALETYELRDFRAVTLSSEGVVTISRGDFAVSASAEDNVLPTVSVERHADTLVLGRDVDLIDGIRPSAPIEYRVAMPELDRLAVSGSGSVAVRGMTTSAAVLQLEIAGAGTIDLAEVRALALAIEVSGAGQLSATGVEADEIGVEVSGSGRVSLAGSADSLQVAVSAASLLRASQLRTIHADIEITGVGQAVVWAEDSLQARVDGAGRVLYRGAPMVRQTMQRGGELVALGSLWSENAAASPREDW